ncbi:MAG: hypothetical protein M1343_14075 [Chloroflexi bacterium]|nr:hypothetical protein [Chloroflexota bacterium]MDA8186611.1 hypothetical protein [Dehalococcoidales bacterium]
MRRGTFEENDGAGGQKVYRLKWDATQYVLTPREILSGLFIRYLISHGKLSEYFAGTEPSVVGADD